MSVAIKKCNEYDFSIIEECVRELFAQLKFDKSLFDGKNVVIKPNFVAAVNPDTASITNPLVVTACAKIIKEFNGQVLIAESPGGLYTENILKNLYNSTGILDLANNYGIELNYDVSYGPMPAKNGKSSRYFEIIRPILDADIIVDVSKLKSHTLTQLSANVKNLFGCIPGVFKAEQHARFKNQEDFMVALVDLAEEICNQKKVICITDAIVGMEGNGPTGGTPKKIGCLLASDNIFEADLICARLVNQFDDEKETKRVRMLAEAYERNLCPSSSSEVEVVGDDYNSLIAKDFIQPDTNLKKWFDVIPKWLSPKPQITVKCIGCGKCAQVCPAKTIKIIDTNGKKKAKINYHNCIHCFCCQELCPLHAVSIHKNFVFKILK